LHRFFGREEDALDHMLDHVPGRDQFGRHPKLREMDRWVAPETHRFELGIRLDRPVLRGHIGVAVCSVPCLTFLLLRGGHDGGSRQKRIFKCAEVVHDLRGVVDNFDRQLLTGHAGVVAAG
jgi:hypothetical protein